MTEKKKVRYRGPNGAVFVPGPAVSRRTIEARVKAGEWTPVDEAPSPRKRPAKAKAVKQD